MFSEKVLECIFEPHFFVHLRNTIILKKLEIVNIISNLEETILNEFLDNTAEITII